MAVCHLQQLQQTNLGCKTAGCCTSGGRWTTTTNVCAWGAVGVAGAFVRMAAGLPSQPEEVGLWQGLVVIQGPHVLLALQPCVFWSVGANSIVRGLLCYKCWSCGATRAASQGGGLCHVTHVRQVLALGGLHAQGPCLVVFLLALCHGVVSL